MKSMTSCCDDDHCTAVVPQLLAQDGSHEHEPDKVKVGSETVDAGAELPAGVGRAVFLIQKMDCPTEERLIRSRLGAWRAWRDCPST
jgi:Cd2+/Zn2+-exporting ATPase